MDVMENQASANALAYARGAMDHAAIIRAGVEARVQEIEGGLFEWMADHIGPADNAALAAALLRLTISQHVAMMGERDALELLHEMFPKPRFDA